VENARHPLFAGTPFRALSWRLMGVRIGKRLFDDGAAITEKTLVTLGDDVVLNAGSVIQCHSLEDGTFKSDYTVLGDGVVLGVAAFVHYGVTLGRGSTLGTDAFLMKGEETAPFTKWAGNPATEIQSDQLAATPVPATMPPEHITRPAWFGPRLPPASKIAQENLITTTPPDPAPIPADHPSSQDSPSCLPTAGNG